MTARKTRHTREETKAVKEEYARLFGPAYVALAAKLRMSVAWMDREIQEFKQMRHRRDAIKAM